MHDNHTYSMNLAQPFRAPLVCTAAFSGQAEECKIVVLTARMLSWPRRLLRHSLLLLLWGPVQLPWTPQPADPSDMGGTWPRGSAGGAQWIRFCLGNPLVGIQGNACKEGTYKIVIGRGIDMKPFCRCQSLSQRCVRS